MIFKKMLLVMITVCLTMLPVSGQGWAVSDGGWSDRQDEQGYISIDHMIISTGCQREYLNINGWGRLEGGYVSIDALELVANEASKFLGIKDGYDFFSNEDEGIRQVNIRGVNEKEQVVSIVCQSIDASHGKNKKWESYIVIDVVDRIHEVNSLNVKAQMESFFDTIGTNANITTTLVGSFKGKLSQKDMEGICGDLFNRIQASTVEGIIDEGLVSISGYSPLLGESITSGGNPVNIQVAMRYNSYKGRTYLWIGTPIISIEY